MHEARLLGMHAPGGWIDFENAYAYTGHQMRIAHRDGHAESIDEKRLAEHSQFALEMDHMAECVRADRVPHTPGEEGLQDQRIMEAIYRSANGQPVALGFRQAVTVPRPGSSPPIMIRSLNCRSARRA